jgi:hypothetical protein
VKIEWAFKKNTVAPYFVMVPDTLKAVATIEKDTKRFPDTHGWAYAEFDYEPRLTRLRLKEQTPNAGTRAIR